MHRKVLFFSFVSVFTIFLSACSAKKSSNASVTPSVAPQSSSAPTIQTTPQVSAFPTSDVSQFSQFSNKRLSFSYPPELKVSENQGKVMLNHSIAFKHPDHCDFQGSGKTLDELADFNLNLEITDADLKGTLEKRGETYLTDQVQGNAFVVEKGFIDSVDVGKYHGYSVLSGVEGCGNIVYYVPISDTRTLVIERSLVPELAPINTEFEKNKQLPGVIQPEQESVWVESILKTVQVL